MIRVRPTPSEKYLHNPHRGCCTFQKFNGDPLFPGTSWTEVGPTAFPPADKPVADGYLPCTVAYCRWFWEILEPKQGEYDFSVIDAALLTAQQRGQTLAVRLMAFGSPRQPQVPKWYAQKYPMIEEIPHRTPMMVPVHDSPEYLRYWGGLIREFARRYDSHPALESIDVAYIGPWGEGNGNCSREQCERFAQLWQEAFPNTPRLSLIGGDQMRASIARGAGWRCDCFGDVTSRRTPQAAWGGGSGWNHTYECYPREIQEGGAQEAWKTGPVHLETCWVPMAWYEKDFDIDFILQQGYKYHASYFMPKSTALPDPWMEKLSDFCNRIGYRFVLRHAGFDERTRSDGSFNFQCWIENMGVAPIYRRYDFGLRLRQGDREQIVVLDDVDVRRWLPGDAWIQRRIWIPQGFGSGRLELAAGLLDRQTRRPRVHFAVEQASEDGWVDLQGLELT